MTKPPLILEGESLDEFNALSESLYSQFEPVTFTERTFVDMLVHHEWFMRRALRMQEALSAVISEDNAEDAKKLALVVRYHKTHERAFAQAKRQLESMRKHNRRMLAMEEKQATAARSSQRQWEQILKKMPPLTDWVN